MSLRESKWRWIRITVLSLLAIVVFLIVAGWIERERNAEEEYVVHSAYLSEGLLNDAHDWSVGGPVQVIIRDRTNVGGNFRILGLYAADRRVGFERMHTSTWVSYVLRNLFSTRLLPKFVLPSRATVALVSQSEIRSPEFQTKFPQNLGSVVLSGV